MTRKRNRSKDAARVFLTRTKPAEKKMSIKDLQGTTKIINGKVVDEEVLINPYLTEEEASNFLRYLNGVDPNHDGQLRERNMYRLFTYYGTAVLIDGKKFISYGLCYGKQGKHIDVLLRLKDENGQFHYFTIDYADKNCSCVLNAKKLRDKKLYVRFINEHSNRAKDERDVMALRFSSYLYALGESISMEEVEISKELILRHPTKEEIFFGHVFGGPPLVIVVGKKGAFSDVYCFMPLFVKVRREFAYNYQLKMIVENSPWNARDVFCCESKSEDLFGIPDNKLKHNEDLYVIDSALVHKNKTLVEQRVKALKERVRREKQWGERCREIEWEYEKLKEDECGGYVGP